MCLDTSGPTSQASWLRGLINNINRSINERANKAVRHRHTRHRRHHHRRRRRRRRRRRHHHHHHHHHHHQGDELDQSAMPLYLNEHIKVIIRAYSLAGTPEAAIRKFALNSLAQAAGRAGEEAWVSFDSLAWDPFYKMVLATVLQSKVTPPPIHHHHHHRHHHHRHTSAATAAS